MKKQLIMFLIFLISISAAYSYGPNYHLFLTDNVFDQTSNPMTQLCSNHIDYVRAGTLIPDITITKYYDLGGKDYKLTHNWVFYEDVRSQIPNDDIEGRCFAYGIALHLIQDGVSHNKIIPEGIEKWKIPNSFFHPLYESKIELQMLKQNPEYLETTTRVMGLLFESENERMLGWVQNAMGDSDINVKEMTLRLSNVLGTFYEDAYSPYPTEKQGFMFYVWKGIRAISNIIPMSGFDDITRLSVQQTDYIFDNWNERTTNELSKEPHGFTNLKYANTVPDTIKFVGLVVIVIYVVKNLGKIKRRFKK